MEFIFGRRGFGLQMGKFCQISTELWPLIYAKILLLLSILSIYRPVFIRLCKGAHFCKEWFGIIDG